MPELPEVETVVRGLRQTIVGKTVSRTRVFAPAKSIQVGEGIRTKSLSAGLRGRQVVGIDRRGKNILIRLSGNTTLWVHLKMTGVFSWVDTQRPFDKHDLIVIDFDGTTAEDGNRHLRFNDYRRFGRFRLVTNEELQAQPGMRELGPEPLQISADDFVVLCRSRRRMIKPALLDQSFLAGLGNIYADESLYYSRIHPRRMTSSVSSRKLIELHTHIQAILKRAIRLMGTTVDSYAGINGHAGRFQQYLRVYNREGGPCSRCGSTITREKIGSRSAHFCPRCQRVK